ncbi:MAG: V-type ATP synthase subunit F [Thermoplasmata archaeon]
MKDDYYSIVVIGERELVLGYKMIGCDESYNVDTVEEGAKKLRSIFTREDVGLIIASDFIRNGLTDSEIDRIQMSVKPLVVFVPSERMKGKREEEVLREVIKRVLGINLEV